MPRYPEKIGKYEIVAEIGRGGMGTVFKARDPVLDRTVALKTMFREVLAEPGMRDRFLREARSAARLQHPNIVTVFEFGEVDGAPFIAMELLEGENLATALVLGRFSDLAGKLRVVAQLCEGLAYAHQHGVIHRDVKPTNVSLLPGGVVKIVDFGIAWLEGGTLATRTGQLLGTPSYMAPEQFAGEPVDHRVDVWAVGVILYEMLTGGRPFDAGTVPSLIYKIVHTEPPPISQRLQRLPPRLVELVEGAMAKDVRQRTMDLGVMARGLREVAGELPAGVAGTGSPARPVVSAGAMNLAATMVTPVPTGDGCPPAPVLVAPTLVAPRPARPGRQVPFVEDGVFGEPKRVQALALSGDDTLIAAGGTDGSIRLWELNTRMKVATLRNRVHLRSGHGSLTTSLAFSDDGSLLASGHLDGAVYVWEVETGLELDVRLGHEGGVGGLAFSPDGEMLITTGSDATIKFWEMRALRSGDPRRVLRRQPEAATCLALARSGRLVVTGHSNRSLRLHDTASQKLVATLHGHRAPLSCIAVPAAGDLVASGARDGTIRIQNVDTRELVGAYQEHGRAVADLVFLPGGLQVASVAMDSAVVIWDAAAPDIPTTLVGSLDDCLTALRLTGDGQRLVCAGADGHFRIWHRAS